MKIAIYSKNYNKGDAEFVDTVVKFLSGLHHSVLICDSFKQFYPSLNSFKGYEDLKKENSIDFILSLGGDGTFLDTASVVGDLNIPIVGINTGRIGFLTGINKNDFETAFQMLQEGSYELEERSLLHLECGTDIPRHFALNDITIHSQGESYLSATKVWINGQKVNTYWSDGLIIATPTGSTAYSLSCGGPIILPYTNVNVITPIASHSLSVRPIVVSADDLISVSVEGRGATSTLTLDSHRIELPNPLKLEITKEKFTIKTVRFNSVDFFSVIREKLMWGMDRRNNNEETEI